MRAVFFGLLVYSWVGVVRAQLVSPSMLHHGPLLTQVVLDGGHRSDVYRLYSATYATALTREYCVVVSSASAHGFALNILGEGRQAHFDQDRFLDKLWALRDFVVEMKMREAWEHEHSKDEMNIDLRGLERHYWNGTEAGLLRRVHGFRD
jgi:hypothetical protein